MDTVSGGEERLEHVLTGVGMRGRGQWGKRISM